MISMLNYVIALSYVSWINCHDQTFVLCSRVCKVVREKKGRDGHAHGDRNGEKERSHIGNLPTAIGAPLRAPFFIQKIRLFFLLDERFNAYQTLRDRSSLL